MNNDNPFSVTKSSVFTNEEIKKLWVDWEQEHSGFRELTQPTSAMPMLIIGGKGSGKTHLMRYLSYPVKSLDYHCPPQNIMEEGFLGIYLLASGLNANRFSGKGRKEEEWAGTFAYSFDIWLSMILLETVQEAYITDDDFVSKQAKICQEIIELFDIKVNLTELTLDALLVFLKDEQRSIDLFVNNCALNRSLPPVTVKATAGNLIWGIPKILSANVQAMNKVLFLFLIDELENFSELQQRYVNTLIRERRDPCSFKVGARLYGVKTKETFTDGEENKEDSEFELLKLDDYFRKNGKYYKDFSYRLIAKRLANVGDINNITVDSFDQFISNSFFTFPTSDFHRIETEFIFEKFDKVGKPRPYMVSFASKIAALATQAEMTAEEACDIISVPEYPFLEKVNIFTFYKRMTSKANFKTLLESIKKECCDYIEDRSKAPNYKQQVEHFSSDLIAQMLADGKGPGKQRYLGISTFIQMSNGIPRNLLTILKHVYKWSLFKGEKPFKNGSIISEDSQLNGVKEASEWFFKDARIAGPDGRFIRDSIERLATLFREVRFSDKPAECSLSGFSTDLTKIGDEANRILELAVKWSLLIEVEGGQHDRNSERLDAKFQINPMLASRWDLPCSRRGILTLNSEIVDSIFGSGKMLTFDELKAERVKRMNFGSFEPVVDDKQMEFDL